MEWTKMVKVLLISSSRLLREGMKPLLAGSPYRIEMEATDLEEALEKLPAARDVELVLFDFVAARKDAVEHIQKMRDIVPKARLIILSDDTTIVQLARTLGNGADGYLLKDTSPDALVQVLNLAMLGERVFPTCLVRMLIDGRTEADGWVPSVSATGLSEREVEILRHLVDGASNKAIANRLTIAESTVKVHMKGILRKIRRKNRTQAAIWAVQNGLDHKPVPSVAGEAPLIAGMPTYIAAGEKAHKRA